MRNHQYVNGKLLQTNKKFSQLKEHKKTQISEWLYEAYRNSFLANGKPPAGDNDTRIIDAVMALITDAEIWVPEREIAAYYRKRKTHFCKRFEKETNHCRLV